MSKTNKNKGKFKTKQNKTKKNIEKEVILPNLTPLTDRKLSDNIAKGIKREQLQQINLMSYLGL